MRTRAGCSGACVQVSGAVNASPADPKEPGRMLGEAQGWGEVSITKKHGVRQILCLEKMKNVLESSFFRH